MAQSPTVKPSLRRSFSEHVKDSTNKAWDVFWRNVRETRLWGESGNLQLVREQQTATENLASRIHGLTSSESDTGARTSLTRPRAPTR
ncbi:hypothetical protein Q5P01_019065 [Channa striata]|uniref:Uncharacterized protein n=1 Tax=Channa striata TaxID=64152 RepID=A0AA88M0S2_CHASR|nr:hypothetical protein Q5P01_019065 [Channa striata]